MRRGRPPKHRQRRDIKGLRNQLPSHAAVSSISESDYSDDLPSKRPRLSHSRSRAPSPASISDHASEDNWEPPTVFDSLKFAAKNDESDIESDAEDITYSDGLVDDSSCCSRLIDFAASIGDDPCDETWLPPREAKRLAQRKARPSHYKKGPDVGSKSVRSAHSTEPPVCPWESTNCCMARSQPAGGLCRSAINARDTHQESWACTE